MSLKNKNEIIKKFMQHEKDCGSVEVQVIDLTDKIKKLTEHTVANPKDHSSKVGLLKMVNRRKKFLDYTKKHNEPMYKELIKELGLRK